MQDPFFLVGLVFLFLSSTISTSMLLVISVIKFANACSFMFVYGFKSISFSLYSTAHLARCPNFFVFNNTLRIGLLVKTSIGCAKKYLLDNLVVLERDKARFSMLEYPISAPCKTRLMKYMGTFFSSLLATSIVLTANFDVDKYIVSISPETGDPKVNNSANVILCFFKDVFASSVHLKSLFSNTLLRVLYKGNVFRLILVGSVLTWLTCCSMKSTHILHCPSPFLH